MGYGAGFRGDPDNRRTEKDRERDSGGVREGQRRIGESARTCGCMKERKMGQREGGREREGEDLEGLKEGRSLHGAAQSVVEMTSPPSERGYRLRGRKEIKV